MTYVTATERHAMRGMSMPSQRAYTRHGILSSEAARFRQVGVFPPVAKAMHSAGMSSEDIGWLASTFSLRALRALFVLREGIDATGVQRLQQAASVNLSRTRAYASKTVLSAGDVLWMVQHDVPCSVTIAWTLRLPFEHSSTNLAAVLRLAVMSYFAPDTDVADWVRYANRFDIPYDGSQGRLLSQWSFLGGDTGLMVQAGIAPSEADEMTRGGLLERDTLMVMAGLRLGSGR